MTQVSQWHDETRQQICAWWHELKKKGLPTALPGALFLPVEVERPLELTGQTVTRLLKKPVSSGYVEADRWCFSVRKGHHEGLISFRTHQQIQDRLEGRKRRPAARADFNEDFPLRRFVACDCCGLAESLLCQLRFLGSQGKLDGVAQFHRILVTIDRDDDRPALGLRNQIGWHTLVEVVDPAIGGASKVTPFSSPCLPALYTSEATQRSTKPEASAFSMGCNGAAGED